MAKTNPERRKTDDADAWFFNLESMARRIEENERRDRRSRNRQNAIMAFVIFAFCLTAYRSEINADRIAEQRRASCQGGLLILGKFNSLQDSLAEIERQDTTTRNPERRDARIAAYEKARILPLPQCQR